MPSDVEGLVGQCAAGSFLRGGKRVALIWLLPITLASCSDASLPNSGESKSNQIWTVTQISDEFKGDILLASVPSKEDARFSFVFQCAGGVFSSMVYSTEEFTEKIFYNVTYRFDEENPRNSNWVSSTNGKGLFFASDEMLENKNFRALFKDRRALDRIFLNFQPIDPHVWMAWTLAEHDVFRVEITLDQAVRLTFKGGNFEEYVTAVNEVSRACQKPTLPDSLVAAAYEGQHPHVDEILPVLPSKKSLLLGVPYNGEGDLSQGPDMGNHEGVMANAFDFPLPSGTEVMATAEGVVIDFQEQTPDFRPGEIDYEKSRSVERTGGLGNYVTIRYADGSGGHYYATYAHLQQGSVTAAGIRLNLEVYPGFSIGRVGRTGGTIPARDATNTRDHLHVHFGSRVSDKVVSTSRPWMKVADGSDGIEIVAYDGMEKVLFLKR